MEEMRAIMTDALHRNQFEEARLARVHLFDSWKKVLEVTVIEQLSLTDTERAEWLRSLKSALGCGGALDGTAIVLQGDQRSRVPALLTARHVKKVIVS